MASAAVVAGLLAGWGLAALVTGLVIGRAVRMRERQHPGVSRRRALDLVAPGRALASRADVLGD